LTSDQLPHENGPVELPMVDLAGTLASFGMAPLVKLLLDLGKSGDLLVWQGPWKGHLAFEHGQLSAAAFGPEHGTPALEFICSTLLGGEFEFWEGTPGLPPNLGLLPAPLEVVERFAAGVHQSWVAQVPGPTSIPHLIDARAADDFEVALERIDIHVLMDVDGVRTVREIATRHGWGRSIRSLARLHELVLIGFDVDRNAGLTSPSTRGRPGQVRHL
jgi:hypothetical protein